jgi:D-beta-D-heptose 7-phosphate kinase/D-beta-D-heptose 1-phosphate adenosyltransferase
LAALGCANLYVFGYIGADLNGEIAKELLKRCGATDCTDITSDIPTTTKERFFCDRKIVFRTDREAKPAIAFDEEAFRSKVLSVFSVQQIDCVLLSDYNKGYLSKDRCQIIVRLCNERGIPTVVDPKEDFTKYIGCTLIKPNKKEAYQLFSIPSTTTIPEVHRIIRDRIGCKVSVVTLAEEGISVGTAAEFVVTHAVAQHTVDVTGAGDIVATIFAYFLHRGMSLKAVAELATKVGTKSVGCPGTYTITKQDIHEFEFNGQRLFRIDQVRWIPEIHVGKRVVFTNGCFDLLHSGHIELFKFCRAKGDVVVVGLNSDASITRLKGPTRPINPLQVRADLLLSMSYIDYVVVFDEDTPRQVLKELKPYYLIKGGDYTIDSIVGREYATETIVCNLVEGLSTTNTVRRIQGTGGSPV